MSRVNRLAPFALGVLAVVACNESLDVENPNNPDVGRVFAAVATIEQTLGTGYQQCRNAYQQNAVEPQVLVLSLESYSQLNNFSMGVRVGIPRTPIVNSRGGPGTGEPFTHFSLLSRLSRQLSNGIGALDQIKKDQPTQVQDGLYARVKSFGFFGVACALGNIALLFDSAGVVGPGMPSDSIPPLSDYKAVMNAALSYLDSAQAIASTSAAVATGGYPAPAAWMSGTAVSRDQFVQIVRQVRARFRAQVARTPAERGAVNWDLVIADANAGVTAPVSVTIGGSTGWNIGFQSSQMHVSAGWSQISPMYWGMADVSGGYDAWLATPLNSRAGFLVVTPDKRWPQGATRAAQQANAAPGDFSAMPYIRNRSTSLDVPGDPWGTSNYDYVRFKYIRDASSTGPWAEFRPEEAQLLAAEGYIRKGQIALAAAKIDLTRTRAGLPALAGAVNSLTDPVPGGSQCVPRVPAAPSFTSTSCGNILEAMKYEMRIEMAHGRFGSWYFDSRGWGDLVTGTAFQFPVPNQEMDARAKPFYDMGGGGPGTAARGTYGF
ncbi:MAG: RagB/SusD family nutrient uptake outer membrane protein [Gemmatimonadetes bacterium]|nr:RagB/SusD family nutrient uptake outer membrane protein [Gemmatimonadota bacterium]